MRHLVILIFFLLFIISCGPIYESCFEELKFEIPVQMTGVSDTISRGNSFTIHSLIPLELDDVNGNGNFDIQEIEIPVKLYLYKIDKEIFKYAFDSILLTPKIGEYSINTFSAEKAENNIGYSFSLKFVKNEFNRELEFDIEINERGLYCLSLQSIYHNFDPDFIDGCQENLEYNSINLNGGDIYDNNYNMFLQSPAEFVVENYSNENDYRDYGCYTFYVR